jgi:hypothetical protein
MSKKINNKKPKENMRELEKAIQLVGDARNILNKLLDKKLSEHTLYYYHKNKGMGFASLEQLEKNRDKLLISTLINNLQKML